ncbi:MAG: DUF1992 domain-containing protein [Propionibacteriaceae bacterium]|jgi:hypothetical protein|nr:DUF1992 domain-containing protein [Propionibacteriaceae bacterium]
MPVTPPFETWADRQIRLAQERGEFDNLPGAGRPLRMRYPNDPDWWVKQKLEDEDLREVLPTPLALRRAKQDLQTTLADVRSEAEARQVVDQLNDQIKTAMRNPSVGGPQIIVGLVDADAAIAQWRARRDAASSD